MAQVTFPPELGGSGITISDDGNPTTGLAAGGHRTRFVPALQQIVAMGQHAHNKAAEAGSHVQAATDAKLAAQEAADRADERADEVQAQIHQASAHAATAAAQSSAATSAAIAANEALVNVAGILATGIGMFTINEDGDLIATYNDPIQSMAINEDGDLIVTY